MKKIMLNSFLGLALCFAMASCDNTGQQKNDAVETAEDINEEKMESAGMSDNMEDAAEFAVTAASSGMFEVEAGKLAQQKGSSADVKNFGKKMVEDHSKANEELKALAAKKNITLPTTMSSEHQEKMDKLSGLSGAEFDKEYMSLMDDAHDKDVKLFKDVAEDNDVDPEIKAFASKNLPALQMHDEMADTKEDMAKGMDKDTIVVTKDRNNSN